MMAEHLKRQTLPAALEAMTEAAPHEVACRTLDGDSLIRTQFLERVKRAAAYLSAQGVVAGDKVAIISATRAEWLIADMAIQYIGGVTIPVYYSLPQEEVAFILYDSGASKVIVENNEQYQKVLDIAARPILMPAVEDRPSHEVRLTCTVVLAFEDVSGVKKISEFREASQQAVSSYYHGAPSDLATIVYTSGTTGPPKGVLQSHANHLANLAQVVGTEVFNKPYSIFLFLPLAHSFGRLVGYLGIIGGARLVFPAVADRTKSVFDPQKLSVDMARSGAEVFPGVPRIFEKIVAGIRANFVGRIILNLAAVKQSLIQKIVAAGGKAIRTKIFGPNFSHAISGGAMCAQHVLRAMNALGMRIVEGYGLTETCVATNINRYSENIIGSVGPVLEGIEAKLSDQGEVLFRGSNITAGYHNRTAATAASYKDGWFATGDLGHFDDNGYLFITGRKKELIVLSNGKKVAPLLVEEKLRSILGISQAVVLGEGHSFCVAALTLLNMPMLNKSEISREIERLNHNLAPYEQIKKHVFLDEDFSIQNGLLTPTLKVKRDAVYLRYRSEIDSLWRSS